MVDACATAVVRSTIDALVPILAPDPIDQPVPYGVLANLGLGNFTNATAQHATAIEVLAGSLGLPASWIGTVWGEFPFGTAPTAALSGWVDGIVSQGSPSTYPLAIPAALEGQYVAASGTAELLIVTFSVPDTFTTSGGANPDFSDVSTISTLAPSVLATTDPSGSLGFVQTGGAPLDQTEQTVLSASLAVVLPLTILVLIGITMLYFRAPFAPLVTFGGLGIALALGLGGVVLIGTFITKVDTTALTLQNTFVLGVGTDYSIFLVARYREELWKGADPHEAVVTTVTWAGQSIATSGATAALATLALAFSGVALLSQWGMVLSLAVLLAVLVSLTIIPAFLVLAGPRVFWPVTGERFRRQSAATMQARAEEKTYFYRVARGVRRRPKTVVGLTLLLSIPLLFVALTAPISYDFFAQLPSGHPATDGLATLSQEFGAGRAFPTVVLAMFAAPFLVGNGSNATEFADLASLTSLVNTTSGVASVDSPVGVNGAPLTEWIGFADLKPAQQTLLAGTLSGYLGTDERTLILTVYSTSGGLSVAAVDLLGTLKSEVRAFAATHPTIVGTAFGGGAAETYDIQQQTSLATDRMALAVSVGLLVVLFVVLRSWIIPLMAVLTIGLSIGWAWGVTNLVLADWARDPDVLLRPDGHVHPDPGPRNRLQHLPPHPRPRGAPEGSPRRLGDGPGAGEHGRHHHCRRGHPRLRVPDPDDGAVPAAEVDRIRGRDRRPPRRPDRPNLPRAGEPVPRRRARLAAAEPPPARRRRVASALTDQEGFGAPTPSSTASGRGQRGCSRPRNRRSPGSSRRPRGRR